MAEDTAELPELGPPRSELYKWFGRRRLWLRAPFRCKFGFHAKTDNLNWGFGGAGVDWYCPRCQKYTGWTALDDLDDEMRARVYDLVGATGFGQETEP